MTFFEGFESFVGFNLWTMIFAWCNLLILYLFLKKLLFVPIKKMIDEAGSKAIIEVDGGVNTTTAVDLAKNGATMLVAGSALYGAEDAKAFVDAIHAL